jgi:hypothetical protein
VSADAENIFTRYFWPRYYGDNYYNNRELFLGLDDLRLYNYDDCIKFGVHIGWIGIWVIFFAPYFCYAIAVATLGYIWQKTIKSLCVGVSE